MTLAMPTADLCAAVKSRLITPESIANKHRHTSARGLIGSVFVVLAGLALAGCSALPDKPVRATMYDFGPGNLTPQAATREAPLPPLAIDDIATNGGALDNMSVLYRLAYAARGRSD